MDKDDSLPAAAGDAGAVAGLHRNDPPAPCPSDGGAEPTPSGPTPCGRLRGVWDWKSGATYDDVKMKRTLADPAIQRNYFDCGTYFYDGEFNVVKFPKGMSVYHGGGIIADAVVEFPLGIAFYNRADPREPLNPVDPKFVSAVTTKNESIVEVVSQILPVSAGWYSDPAIGRLYSNQTTDPMIKQNCGDKCVLAFKLKKDVVLLLLDDDQNIEKLLLTGSIPVDEKNRLRAMFNLQNVNAVRDGFEGPFTRFRYPAYNAQTGKGKMRISNRAWDLEFTKYLCNDIIKAYQLGYGGYAATGQHSVAHGGLFHLEFAFCNATEYLDRDLCNIYDWQYFGGSEPTARALRGHEGRVVQNYLNQLALYQTYNINWHAGNLLQHSIWTLLFSEYIMQYNTIVLPPAPFVDLPELTAFTAFIHDIGKMSPADTIPNTHPLAKGFKYFSIKKHPLLGKEYIMGTRELPVVDDNLNPIGPLSIKDLFGAFGINWEHRSLVAAVVDVHWEFGMTLKELNAARAVNISEADTSLAPVLAKKYVNDFYQKFKEISPSLNEATFLNGLYVALVVSMADIMGTQPYGVNRLKKKLGKGALLNKASRYFPYITNVPKKYRGGNVAELSQVHTVGKNLADYIMKTAISMA